MLKLSNIVLFLCSLWQQQQNHGGATFALKVTGSGDEEMVRYVVTYTSSVPTRPSLRNKKSSASERFLNFLHESSSALDFVFDAIDNFEISDVDLNFSVIKMRTTLAQWLEDRLDIIPGLKILTIEPDTIHYIVPTTMSTRMELKTSEITPYGIGMVGALSVDDSQISNRKICIIDSGYDYTHPDLPSGDFVTGSDDASVGNWRNDGCGHGTQVAGTIAALGNNNQGVKGVNNRNPNNNPIGIHVVKLYGDNCDFAYGSSLTQSLQSCQDAGANVVSMSFGGPSYASFEDSAFQYYYETAGMLLVASAGNDGNSTYNYPASYDSVISVASIDVNKIVARSSQFNNQVELSAPGVNVLSTVPGGEYAYFSGTSMACPHVSAVAALVWSYDTTRTAQDIRSILQISAEDLGRIRGWDVDYGFGLVRADLAVDTVLSFGSNPSTCPCLRFQFLCRIFNRCLFGFFSS